MAEGDTIHGLARRIGAALEGDPIVAAEAPNPRSPLHRTASRLEGETLESVEARGKHLLLGFDGGLAVRSHLKMSGAWHLYSRGERWRKPRRSAWLALASERAEAVMFGGSELELLKRSALHRHPRLARLGPDILGAGFTAERGVASLRAQRPARELGDALLDQSALAGIGNIYKSEGCFAAGVDPWRAIGDLDDAELAEVVSVTRDLMAAAVESGRQPKRVYKRARQPCPRCRTPIRSRAQGDDARATYWCPSCQR